MPLLVKSSDSDTITKVPLSIRVAFGTLKTKTLSNSSKINDNGIAFLGHLQHVFDPTPDNWWPLSLGRKLRELLALFDTRQRTTRGANKPTSKFTGKNQLNVTAQSPRSHRLPLHTQCCCWTIVAAAYGFQSFNVCLYGGSTRFMERLPHIYVWKLIISAPSSLTTKAMPTVIA